MKNIIKLFLVSVLSILLFTGCGCQKEKTEPELKEEIKENTNENIIKDQELEVFKFTNTSLIYKDGNSILETIVTNTSSEPQYLAEFKINVRDINGNIIVTMTGFIGDSIEANSSKIITSVYGDDLTNATSIDYEIVK